MDTGFGSCLFGSHGSLLKKKPEKCYMSELWTTDIGWINVVTQASLGHVHDLARFCSANLIQAWMDRVLWFGSNRLDSVTTVLNAELSYHLFKQCYLRSRRNHFHVGNCMPIVALRTDGAKYREVAKAMGGQKSSNLLDFPFARRVLNWGYTVHQHRGTWHNARSIQDTSFHNVSHSQPQNH